MTMGVTEINQNQPKSGDSIERVHVPVMKKLQYLGEAGMWMKSPLEMKISVSQAAGC